MTREEVIRLLRQFIHQFDGRDVEDAFVEEVLESAADMLEQDARPADMVPIAFHDRCMMFSLIRRITLEKEQRKTVAEVCALRDQVHNLTLYLKEAFELCPDDLEVLNDRHPGLPGYAPEGQKETNT